MPTAHNTLSYPDAWSAPEFPETTAAAIKPSKEGAFGWRNSVLRGQEKVAEHYRNILAKHQLSHSEREAIRARLAGIEAEIDELNRGN